MNDDKHYFLVTSAGHTGSVWYASALHLHPDITCSVGTDHPLRSFRYYSHAQAEIDAFMNKLYTADDVYAFFNNGINETRKKLQYALPHISIDEISFRKSTHEVFPTFFDELIESSSKESSFCGNVHAFTRGCGIFQNYPEIFKEKDISCLDMIRHPIPRINGVINCLTLNITKGKDYVSDFANSIELSINNNQNLILEISRQYNIDFSINRNKAIFYYNYIYKSHKYWADDIVFQTNWECPTLIFERLREDTSYFSWALSYLTKDKIKVDDDFLKKVYSDEYFNAGKFSSRDKKTMSNPEIWEIWSDWERDLFKEQVNKYSLKSLYEIFDYDFSFI